MRLHLPLLLMLFLMINIPAQADVVSTSGKYYETTEDIKVKVMGGFLTLQRTWIDGQWHFNRHWNRLRIVRNLDDNSIKEIDRNGDIYVKVDDAGKLFRFGKKETIAVTDSGYRWQDRKGNWINFDSEGYFLKYGDRNNVAVTLQYDEQKRLSGVLDHFNEQMLWYSYNEQNQLSEIHDYTQRKVRYAYTGDKLTSVFDLRGNEWKYAYTGNNLTSKTDPENHTTQFSYNANNQLTKIEDEIGVWREYGYDYDKTKDEFYFREKDGVGKVTESWYKNDGKLTKKHINGNEVIVAFFDKKNVSLKKESGISSIIEEDDFGNIIKIQSEHNKPVTFIYDKYYSNLVSSVNDDGVESKYSYNDSGNLIKFIEAEGTSSERKIEYGYDKYGNLSKIIFYDADNKQNITEYFYDKSGNVIVYIDPDGGVVTYLYNANGDVLEYVDQLHNKWVMRRDDKGNLLSIMDPLGRVTYRAYNNIDKVIEKVENKNVVGFLSYDSRGNLISLEKVKGGLMVFTYDNAGNITSITDQKGIGEKREYDSESKLIRIISANNEEIKFDYVDKESGKAYDVTRPTEISYPTFSREFKYDIFGNKISQKDVYNNDFRVTRYSYDDVRRLREIVFPDGGKQFFDYDAQGNKIKLINSLGDIVNYKYDYRGNIVSIFDSIDGNKRFSYDSKNRLIEEILPMGQKYIYEYDSADHLVSKIFPGGEKIEYAYDQVGRIIKVIYSSMDKNDEVNFSYSDSDMLTGYSNATSSASYLFDDSGKKVKETIKIDGFEKTFNYSYFSNGLKKSFQNPEGEKYNYFYNESNLLSLMELPDHSVIQFFYKNNKLVRLGYPGGLIVDYIYDELFRVKSLVAKNRDGGVIYNQDYTYDKNDNIIIKKDNSGERYFSYDSSNRIISASSSDEEIKRVVYDARGNIIQNGVVNGGYNLNNEILSFGVSNFKSDNNGNLIEVDSDGLVSKYKYDAGERLISFEKSGYKVEYSYDPWGNRLTKTGNDSTAFYLNTDEGVGIEYNGDYEKIVEYGYIPNNYWMTFPLFMKKAGKYFFYINDHLGTPQKLIDSSGDEVWFAKYDIFGKATIIKNEVENNLRFPGQYYDVESGLHYNMHRYYSPDTGRYITRDKFKNNQNLNLLLFKGEVDFVLAKSFDKSDELNDYIYGNNNSDKNFDPFGLFSLSPECKPTWSDCVSDCMLGKLPTAVTGCALAAVFTAGPINHKCLGVAAWPLICLGLCECKKADKCYTKNCYGDPVRVSVCTCFSWSWDLPRVYHDVIKSDLDNVMCPFAGPRTSDNI